MTPEERNEFFEMRMKEEQRDKLNRYRVLNQDIIKGQTLFTGSSLMEQFPVNELLMTNGMHQIVYNRGIGGFTTTDMLANMNDMIFDVKPARIFINIGTNDIGAPEYELEKMIQNYENILCQIKERLPEAEVFVMAYYPVNEVDVDIDENLRKFFFMTRTNENINIANQAVEKLAEKLGYRFINVNEGLADENGRLKKEYTIEGVHMYANGYRVILNNLKKYL